MPQRDRCGHPAKSVRCRTSHSLRTYINFFVVGFEIVVLLSEGAVVAGEGAVVGFERGNLFLEAVNEDGQTRLLTDGPLEQVLVSGHEDPVLPILVKSGTAAAELLHVDIDDIAVLHLVLRIVSEPLIDEMSLRNV